MVRHLMNSFNLKSLFLLKKEIKSSNTYNIHLISVKRNEVV